MADTPQAPKMNDKNLWKEETFTDREIGTIRRLSPVTADGAPDASRKAIYMGEAALMTPAGQLPLSFEIPGETLAAAIAGYGPALEKAYKETLEELQEMRRQASQKIVIPQGGLPPGGLLNPNAPPPPGRLKL
jgi:hypothetical protein